MRLARRPPLVPIDDLVTRLVDLEQRLSSGAPPPPGPSRSAEGAGPAPSRPPSRGASAQGGSGARCGGSASTSSGGCRAFAHAHHPDHASDGGIAAGHHGLGDADRHCLPRARTNRRALSATPGRLRSRPPIPRRTRPGGCRCRGAMEASQRDGKLLPRPPVPRRMAGSAGAHPRRAEHPWRQSSSTRRPSAFSAERVVSNKNRGLFWPPRRPMPPCRSS